MSDKRFTIWTDKDGNKWRIITVYPTGYGKYDLQRASGSTSKSGTMSVLETIRRFGVKETDLLLAGYGRETWKRNLTPNEVIAELKKIEIKLSKEGFEKVGTRGII